MACLMFSGSLVCSVMTCSLMRSMSSSEHLPMQNLCRTWPHWRSNQNRCMPSSSTKQFTHSVNSGQLSSQIGFLLPAGLSCHKSPAEVTWGPLYAIIEILLETVSGFGEVFQNQLCQQMIFRLSSTVLCLSTSLLVLRQLLFFGSSAQLNESFHPRE